jgi:hypothetical protein
MHLDRIGVLQRQLEKTLKLAVLCWTHHADSAGRLIGHGRQVDSTHFKW